MKIKLTKTAIERLSPGAKIYVAWDTETRGLGVQVQTSGRKAYVFDYRDRHDKKRRITIAPVSEIDLDGKGKAQGARDRALEYRAMLRDGHDPVRMMRGDPDAIRVEDLAAEWILRRCGTKHLTRYDLLTGAFEKIMDPKSGKPKTIEGAKNLIMVDRYLQILHRDILPAIGDVAVTEVKRIDIVKMLDAIQDRGAAVQADRTLEVVRSMFNWHETRSDEFRSPVVRGMRKTNPNARRRKRVLSDDEIRWLWRTEDGVFSRFVKLALLTAQRRAKLANARFNQIVDNVWIIPTDDDRAKGTGEALRLPEMAMVIVADCRRDNDSDWLFPGKGGAPFTGYDHRKNDFLEKMRAVAKEDGGEVPDWTIHDLRRTAKTLMRRAGVDREISERVMGHALEGLDAVYDHYDYVDEKARALEALASLVDRILHPEDNVVALPSPALRETA